MTDNSPGPQSGLGGKVLGVLAIIADMAAVVAWIGSPGPLFAAVAGSLLFLTGLLLFLKMVKALPKFRATAAIVLMVAGAITVTIVVDRSLFGPAADVTGSAPSDQGGRKAVSESEGSSVPAQTKDHRATSTAPTTGSSPTGPAGAVPLSSVPVAGKSQMKLEGGSLRVDAVDHNNVLLAGNAYTCAAASTMLQADRKYASLRMAVGISDDSDPGTEATLQILADGVAKGGVTVRIGKAEPVEVDVSGALRVELKVDSNKCDTKLGLIDAVAVPVV